MIKLYKKDAGGLTRIWQCEIAGPGELEITHGVLGGEMQRKIDFIETNQSGRDLDAQMILKMESRARIKKQQGYKDSVDDAIEQKGTNDLKLYRPMLAQKFSAVRLNRQLDNAMVQLKYDGNRCLIHNTGRELIAYSRNGKQFNNLEHILDKIDIPTGATIDGELYNHDLKLQEIVSLIKRKQEHTNKIQYIAYDMISDAPFKERFKTLKSYYIPDVAETWYIEDRNIKEMLELSVSSGYEGLMVRLNGPGYEAGKRSKSLLKVKQWLDDYFLITGILESKDGWGILRCITKEGESFQVSAPGNIEYKKEVWKNKEEYIGQMARVEYAYLTKDGIPFHPICTLID
jgi:ATP-dependent DNA ligase